MENSNRRVSQKFTLSNRYYLLHFNEFEGRIKDKKVFMKFFEVLFKKISEKIVEDGYNYKLPHGMGEIYIYKFRPQNPAIDFQTSKKYNKTIYFRNKHSDGWAARWRWDKNRSRIKYKNLFVFRPTKANRKAIPQAIKLRNSILNYTRHVSK